MVDDEGRKADAYVEMTGRRKGKSRAFPVGAPAFITWS
jgi:hypothetical protein